VVVEQPLNNTNPISNPKRTQKQRKKQKNKQSNKKTQTLTLNPRSLEDVDQDLPWAGGREHA
jgi:hypothetical protein